jgi:hypothetical protein
VIGTTVSSFLHWRHVNVRDLRSPTDLAELCLIKATLDT